MPDWRDKFKPICKLMEALSMDDRRILLHALAHQQLLENGVNRALSTGAHSGEPGGVLFVRGQKLTGELERYAQSLGFETSYELRELPDPNDESILPSWIDAEKSLPPERRPVLVWIKDRYLPMVGYIRIHSGGRPFFVVPGGPEGFKVTHWMDCLPAKNPPGVQGFMERST